MVTIILFVFQEFVNCNATVDIAPWRFEQPEVHTQCEPGTLPPMVSNILYNSQKRYFNFKTSKILGGNLYFLK